MAKRRAEAAGFAAGQEVDMEPEEFLLEGDAEVPESVIEDFEPEEDEETLFAAGQADDGTLDATQMYLNEIGFSPLLTAEEEVYYARRAQRGDAAARARMIESNLRLVVKIARRYMSRPCKTP